MEGGNMQARVPIGLKPGQILPSAEVRRLAKEKGIIFYVRHEPGGSILEELYNPHGKDLNYKVQNTHRKTVDLTHVDAAEGFPSKLLPPEEPLLD